MNCYQWAGFPKFLLTSTNQYGVHSPFVYSYVTQCLYGPQMFKGNKTFDVLFKSIEYFKARSIHIPMNLGKLESLLMERFPRITFQEDPRDIIFWNGPECNGTSELLPSMKGRHNNTLLLINAIHRDKTSRTLWETIRNMEQVTVSLDLFYCGAVFFRKEQAKEHFKIRL